MQRVFIDNITPGSIIAEDVFNYNGRILLSKGTLYHESFRRRLENAGINELLIDNKFEDSFADLPKNYFSDQDVLGHHTAGVLSISSNSTYQLQIDDVIYEKTRLQAELLVKKTMIKLNGKSNLKIDKIKDIVNNILEQLLSKKDIVLTLSQIRSVDDYTYEHSVNVCVIALILGIDLKLDISSLKKIGMGAILHDIGKVGVPENILKKPSKLTPEEFEEIKKHTLYGYEILRKTDVDEESALIALHHHEKYDGTGYSHKLKGETIPLFSRIVAVADVYDAISNNRVYRKKMSPDKVYKHICKLGNTHFDNSIMESFIGHLSLYPNGTGVILNTGHKGVVIGQNKLLPESPIIRVFKKEKISIKNSYADIDLSTTKYLYICDTF